MSDRGRSTSPRPLRDGDVEMSNESELQSGEKVVVVKNLTRNVVEAHLRIVFGFYGQITKIDLPVFGKCKCTPLR
jgi:RNA-binding protein with serine-rich domain 1